MSYDIVFQYRLENEVGSTFRFQTWDMERYRDYMLERGMLVERALPQVVNTLTVEWDTGGPIPVYKLCSNDGWHLTPQEIRRSLDQLELWVLRQKTVYGENWADPLAIEDGVWVQWIAFLHQAMRHGGAAVW